MIQITVDTRRAVVTNKELLTAGSAGIQVQFTLSEDWDTLSKLAVFRVGDDGTKVDVPLGTSLTCAVPPEVLTKEDEVLFVGIYGANGQGTVIIPTVWASAGVVKPGTEPETPASAQPTPEIWAQILGVAQNAEQVAGEAYTMAENAQGYIVEETVRNTVDAFVNTTVPAAEQAIAEAQTDAEQAIAEAQTDAEQAVEEKGEEVLVSIPEDYTELVDEVSDVKNAIGELNNVISTKEAVTGDLNILVPVDALTSAEVLSVGASITGIKTTGKNLYPYGNIPRYTYGFYGSSLADAKASGIRLPKGTYTLAYTSSVTKSRLYIRAWTDDGTLLTDNSKFRARYEQNSSVYKDVYWETYRFTSSQWSTSPILSIEVYDESVWFLFCEDINTNYGDITNAMLTLGWNAPESYLAYTATNYDADATQISVTPNGMIAFSASDMTDVETSVQFNFLREDWAKVIAEAFDTSESGYAVGDYCIYGSKLWKCNTAQAQGSTFEVNNWTEICVMDEVKTLSVNVAQLNDNVSNPFMMPFMQSGKPKLFAHAGFKSESAPENTIPAFIAAGEKGYFSIETDVQETSDGYFVMIHDGTLDRTTNGTGAVNEKTLAEIRALHIKDHDDLQVPTLEEYLGICKMYGCVPQIEIKSTITDVIPLLDAVKEFGFGYQCIYSGSPYTNIAAWKQKTNMPFINIYQTGVFPDIEQVIVDLMDVYHYTNMGVAVEGINILSKATIEKCHANNIFTICFVLDDKASVQQAFEKGYDFVTTNRVYLP